MGLRRLLQGFLASFGLTVIGIALAHFAAGPRAIIGGSEVNPTTDGEDRFYAGVFLCYGIGLLWCAEDVGAKAPQITRLAGVLFVGGLGRLVSLIRTGWPHPFYVAMLGLELGLPPLMALAARQVAGQTK